MFCVTKFCNFKVITLTLSFLLLSSLLACTTTKVAPPEQPVPPLPGTQYNCQTGQWCYDDFVKERITPDMRSSDPGIFCPRYKVIGAEMFWPAFEKAVSRAESGWNLAKDYTEPFPDNSGKRQISSGLFQISLDDRSRGGDCADLSPQNIHGNGKNIACAMTIQNILLGSRPTFQASLGRYWSVIRDNKNPTDSTKEKAVTLVDTMKKYVPGCFQ